MIHGLKMPAKNNERKKGSVTFKGVVLKLLLRILCISLNRVAKQFKTSLFTSKVLIPIHK